MAQYLPQHVQHGHHGGHSGQGGHAAHAGSPGAQASSRPLVAPHFPLKHLNIVDPLLPSNNLGRSVSKASYSRVKKALALGSRTLEEALLRVRKSLPRPCRCPTVLCLPAAGCGRSCDGGWVFARRTFAQSPSDVPVHTRSSSTAGPPVGSGGH